MPLGRIHTRLAGGRSVLPALAWGQGTYAGCFQRELIGAAYS